MGEEFELAQESPQAGVEEPLVVVLVLELAPREVQLVAGRLVQVVQVGERSCSLREKRKGLGL